jgi:hypothetical protein
LPGTLDEGIATNTLALAFRFFASPSLPLRLAHKRRLAGAFRPCAQPAQRIDNLALPATGMAMHQDAAALTIADGEARSSVVVSRARG